MWISRIIAGCGLLGLMACSDSSANPPEVAHETIDPCTPVLLYLDSIATYGWLAGHTIGEPQGEQDADLSQTAIMPWNNDSVYVTKRLRFNYESLNSITLTFSDLDSLSHRQILSCLHTICGVFGEGDSNGEYWHHVTESDSLDQLDWMLMDESYEFGEPRISLILMRHGNSFF